MRNMFKSIRPHLKVWHLALLLLVLAVSASSIVYAVKSQAADMRQNLAIYAKTIEKSINWQPLASALQSDVATAKPAALQALQAQLTRACQANANCENIYFIYVEKEQVKYLLDIRLKQPSKTKLAGSPYLGATNQLIQSAQAQTVYLPNLVTHSQNSWVSVYVPLTAMPKTQRLMLGVDVDKSHWNSLLLKALYLPVLFTLILLTFLIGFILHHFNDLADRIRSFEATTIEKINVDALTGLSNRLILDDRMTQAIKVASRAKSMVAILFVDLDLFKNVNDNFGHSVGDQLLKKVADRLNSLMRAEDTIARVGGDEFVILLGNLKSEHQAVLVADKIIEKIIQPFKVGTKTLKLGASVGIAIYPKHGANMQVLIKHADSAMYYAKRQGGGSSAIYDLTMKKSFEKTTEKPFINTVVA